MKRGKMRAVLATAGLILCSAASAMALDVYGFASYWDKGDADGKAGFGIGVSLPVLSDHIRLDGRIYFVESSHFDRDDDLKMIPVDVGVQAHLMPGGWLDPYAVGGLSFVYADADHSDVDSSFGAYLGGGVIWAPFPVINLFGEALYRFQELDGGRGSEIDISGLTGNIGLRINF